MGAAHAGHEVTVCAPMDPSLSSILSENIDEILASNGLKFIQLRMDRHGINPLREMGTLVHIWRIMLKVRPDVVLSFSIKSALYGSLAARFAGIPASYSSITGLGFLFTSLSKNRKLFTKGLFLIFRFALARNSRVFFQNPDDRDLFFRYGLLRDPKQSVIVNGSGVDLVRFAEKPMPPSPTTFLMIARIQYHKGVVEYIQAARLLKKICPEAKFHLVGPFDGHPSALPKAEFDELLKDGVVEYLGPTADVRSCLAQSHVYVLPSYREGTPLSTLEALAMGRAVVTTDVPGCRETVIDEYNGFLVGVGSAESLAQGMGRFLHQPTLANTMGKRSRKLAEEKYDVRKVVSDMLTTMNLA